jgi:hypothetical protein
VRGGEEVCSWLSRRDASGCWKLENERFLARAVGKAGMVNSRSSRRATEQEQRFDNSTVVVVHARSIEQLCVWKEEERSARKSR